MASVLVKWSIFFLQVGPRDHVVEISCSTKMVEK
jgi:hypothetical protein